MTTCTVVPKFHRYVKRDETRLVPWARALSGWIGILHKGMRDLGWIELRHSWSWRHPALRTRVIIKPEQLGWKPKVDAIMRESWRYSCLQKWLARSLRRPQIQPYRLNILRDRCWSSYEFAVLTGNRESCTLPGGA